jgi:putative CocE/NonD family hydrolase
MKTIHDFPEKVKIQEHVWIPMADGTRLAAKTWIPENADKSPVPAILEYIPYRKRDLTAWRDAFTHPYLAGHGYACLRVDLRGSGDSEGVLTDEYLQLELDDGLEILRWIARQPWCNGKVGMMGISWGGFNGLQIAALQPPELWAIITLCSTDDRYADDVHYMGGCLLGDNLSWASAMLAHTSLPPDPLTVGKSWRQMWLQRLEKSGLWLTTWLNHQRRDDYWKHGSICEDFSKVKCPVYAVSGWADGYSNAVFRMLHHLDVPKKGLVGPWGHKYPHLGSPGPAIGFLQEALRWWDHWLKGVDTGIMDEPMLRVWMQDSVPPVTNYTTRPGRWVAERAWPSGRIRNTGYTLTQGRLERGAKALPEERYTILSPLSVGLFAGKWCSFRATPDLPHDQREEDGGALIFDSPPLDNDLEILGAPVAALDIAADKPVAMLAVRLSDVAPDDKATRVTFGLLNLTHRESHERPAYLEPRKRYRIRVPLNDIAQVFPKGHRLRLSLSTSYWPLVWPPPEPVRLEIFTGYSRLYLPERDPLPLDCELTPFPDPEGARALPTTSVIPRQYSWKVIRDLAGDVSTLEVVKDEGTYRLEKTKVEILSKTVEKYTYWNDDFTSVRGETYCERGFRRDGWKIKTIMNTVLTSTQTHFQIQADIDAFEDTRRLYANSWYLEIPRDFT